MTDTHRNWAGNIAYGATAVHTPASIEELQDIVRTGRKLRGLGSRHSFNRIADTDGEHISMRGLNRLVAIDRDAMTVTVEGGITYGELGPALHAQGFALHNLASLPHISVVGAVSTATHGSGNTNGNLATAVAALEIVTASGEIVGFARGEPGFDGAVVGLGALGIVSRITLDIQPSFEVRQDVFLDLPFEALVENFEAITSAAYSVSSFITWRGDHVGSVWLKGRAGQAIPGDSFFGARRAPVPAHPLPGIDATPVTAQLGVPGPWYERLPHFRMEFQPSAGEELQSEYFVPRSEAVTALIALKAIQHEIAGPLMVSEIRTMAADELWLSHNYRQDSLAFHFTWHQDWPAVAEALRAIEAALAPLSPRPHWGKLFTMDRETLQSRYPRLAEFKTLATRLDPEGKFRNAFLEEYVF